MLDIFHEGSVACTAAFYTLSIFDREAILMQRSGRDYFEHDT